MPKCPAGIQGLDEITGGGLPRGRPTLVCGGAGCGKTLLAAEFLVRGAVQFDEPGVLMAFEETEKELKANVASLGFDLDGLVRRKKSWLITSTSSVAKFRRAANMTWKGCSCGSVTRLIHRCQARGAGLAGSAVRQLAQRSDFAERAAPDFFAGSRIRV